MSRVRLQLEQERVCSARVSLQVSTPVTAIKSVLLAHEKNFVVDDFRAPNLSVLVQPVLATEMISPVLQKSLLANTILGAILENPRIIVTKTDDTRAVFGLPCGTTCQPNAHQVPKHPFSRPLSCVSIALAADNSGNISKSILKFIVLKARINQSIHVNILSAINGFTHILCRQYILLDNRLLSG